MRQVGYRLDYMWFLGLRLDDPTPNHSVLSKARRRWGPEVFERLFVRTVEQCVEAGLVDGTKLHMDSTLIDANASKDSVKKGSLQLVSALRRLYTDQEAKLESLGDEPAPTAPTEADKDNGETDAKADALSPKVNAALMSTTDADAAIVRKNGGNPRPRYKHHRAVDDAHGVITAVATTGGDADEGQLLTELIDQHEQHTGSTVRTAIGDGKYGTIDNYLRCARRGIAPHMVDLQSKQKHTGGRANIFDTSRFIYDASNDTYICPAGERMHPRSYHRKRQSWDYVTNRGVCVNCELRSQCTRSKTGRSIKRHVQQDRIDRARREANSSRAKRDLRRRKHLMEGSFAQGANHHHLQRSRWRRLWRQEIQDWLIAAAQNIKLLLTRRQPRRRWAMTVATLLHAPVALYQPVIEAYDAVLNAWTQRATALLARCGVAVIGELNCR